MSNALVTTDKDELEEIGHEIQTLLPGGNKLTKNQAIALGKYAQLTRANPFRGEVYGFQGKNGELALVDGYKQLVRWAERTSKFDDNYTLLKSGDEGLTEGDIGYRCTIMRHDKKAQLREYIQMGATFTAAYNLVASSAVGVVRKAEMWSKKWNRAIDPPSGWTWDQVARKRGLKNALNIAFPMPSIDELAAESWTVNGTETMPDDWDYAAQLETEPEKIEHAASLIAEARERQAERDNLTTGELHEQAQANINAMRDPVDFDVLADDTNVEEGEVVEEKKAEAPTPAVADPIPSESAQSQPKAKYATDPATQLWRYVGENGIDREAAKQIINEVGGDIDRALEKVMQLATPPDEVSHYTRGDS